MYIMCDTKDPAKYTLYLHFFKSVLRFMTCSLRKLSLMKWASRGTSRKKVDELDMTCDTKDPAKYSLYLHFLHLF